VARELAMKRELAVRRELVMRTTQASLVALGLCLVSVSVSVSVSGCGVFLPGVWYDEEHDLMWEEPGSGTAFYLDEAENYCAELDLFDRTNWHAPNIDQLRTIMKGCDKPCAVSTDCPTWPDCSDGCSDGCTLSRGPDDGCYWSEPLSGSCGDLFEDYWSITEALGSDPSGTDPDVWLVDFQRGAIKTSLGEDDQHFVRCVAVGPGS